MNRDQRRLSLLRSKAIGAIGFIKTIRRLKTSGIVRWEGVKQCQIHGSGDWKNSRSEYSSNELYKLIPVKKKSIIQSTNTTGFPVVRQGHRVVQLPTNRDRAIAGGIKELSFSDE